MFAGLAANLTGTCLAVALCVCGSDIAVAQGTDPVRVRGTIIAVAGDRLVVAKPDASNVVVHLAPHAKIIAAVKASLVDVTPGTYVGIANTGPTGLQDAIEVHIFPDAMRGSGEGQIPWDIGGHSRMTVGTASARVEAYDGQDVTLSYKGGESTIQVRPNTPVVQFVPGGPADLKAGAAIFIDHATQQPDGSLANDTVVVGRGGAKPSM